MSDDRLINQLRDRAIDLEEEHYPRSADVMRGAADRLAQLTAAKEPVEGSVRLRMAVAMTGRHHAVYAVRKELADDSELLGWAISDLDPPLTHQAFVTVDIPPINVPTVTAQVEEAKP